MIIEQLYDALIEGGTSEQKARDAARAVADFHNAVHELRLDNSEIKSTQRLHSWMLSTTVALLIVILFKVFSK